MREFAKALTQTLAPTLIGGLMAAGLLAGCLGPSGLTTEARHRSVLEMRSDTLSELFRLAPAAWTDLVQSHGYGVFSNFGVNLFLASTASGYGVVQDRRTGDLTFMRMMSVGIGPGLGVKDYRAILIFTQRRALDDFMANGWDAILQSDFAIKVKDAGEMIALSTDVAPGIKLYHFTESGLALQATVQGGKYWRDNELKSLRAAGGL